MITYDPRSGKRLRVDTLDIKPEPLDNVVVDPSEKYFYGSPGPFKVGVDGKVEWVTLDNHTIRPIRLRPQKNDLVTISSCEGMLCVGRYDIFTGKLQSNQ